MGHSVIAIYDVLFAFEFLWLRPQHRHRHRPLALRHVAAASMHSLTVARHRLPQLIDRPFDPMPHPSSLHVAGGKQLVRTLGGM